MAFSYRKDSRAYDCFAIQDGQCTILTETNCKKCKFFKTKEQLQYEQARSCKRLAELQFSV